MLFAIFLKGLVIGFSLAAPIGPVGMMCIRRKLADGQLRGFVSGLGAATADSVYAIVAAFGLTLVSNFVVEQEYWIRLVGGILLIALGLRTLLVHAAEKASKNGVNGHASAYVTMFLLTFTNPMTLFAFAVVFAGMGAGRAVGQTLTASFVHFYKDKFKVWGLKAINIVAGSFILLCGIVILLTIQR
jgi:threonine/homoserine/homoserine lactone efflux protein